MCDYVFCLFVDSKHALSVGPDRTFYQICRDLAVSALSFTREGWEKSPLFAFNAPKAENV